MWTGFSPLIVLNRISLFQHLESAPKEILGDFPRFTREAAAAIVFKTEAKHKGWLDNLDDDMPDHARNQVSTGEFLQIVIVDELLAFIFSIGLTILILDTPRGPFHKT